MGQPADCQVRWSGFMLCTIDFATRSRLLRAVF
jgi:hypothetical protein